MQPLEIIVTGDASKATVALKKTQEELGKTAIAAQKSDSSLAKLGSGFSSLGSKSQIASTALSSIGDAAGGAVSGVASLGSTLLTGGILLAIPLIISGLSQLGEALFGASDAEKAFLETTEAGIKAFGKASATVSELKVQIDLAKNGFIDKDEVVKHYNDTIGKTTGIVRSVEQAEAALIAKGPAYIQFMFLKAKATFAFAQAAEFAVKAEVISAQSIGSGGPVSNAFKSFTTDLNKQSAAFSKIAEEAEKLAGIVSQENDFSFFGKNADKEFKATDAYLKLMKKMEVKQVTIKPKKIKVEPERDVEVIVPKTMELKDVNEELKFKIKFKPQVEFTNEEALEEMRANLQRTVDSFKNIAVDIFSSIGPAIENSIAGRGNIFGNLFGGILKALGSGLQQMGVKVIAASEAIQAAKAALKIGSITGIAAGIGLIALGALISAAAANIKGVGGLASGSTGISRGGIFDVGERGRERIFLPQGTKVQPNNELNAYGGGNIVLQPSILYSGSGFRVMLDRVDREFGRNN